MENKDNNSGNNNKNKKQNQQMRLIILVVSVVLFVILSYMRTMFSNATNQKITYDAFIEKLDNGEVDSVVISADEITIMPKGQENAYKTVVKGAVGGAAGVIHVAESATTDCQPNENVEALRAFL